MRLAGLRRWRLVTADLDATPDEIWMRAALLQAESARASGEVPVGAVIVVNGAVIGEVTSGTLSPTLGKSIALGYVDANLSSEGTQLSADLKGTPNPAKVVKLPFYKRK